jgi:hypothetical protein
VLVLVGITAALVASHVQDDDSTRATHVQGSGIPASERRDLPPSFASVELAGANTVAIRVGQDRQAVVVRGDANLLDHVTTEVRDGELTIASHGRFTTATPMRVDLTIPWLESVTLSGNGTIRVDGVNAEHLFVQLPGSGVLEANGSTERLDVSLTGSGVVRLGDLVAQDVTARVAGTGELDVHATHSLHASLSGAGAIFYRGDPATLTQEVTGTGTISKRSHPRGGELT